MVIIKRFKTLLAKQMIDFQALSDSNTNGGFFCVFGRNGCGKSCLVDALAFCFGASATQMRVTRLADLINHAAIKRSTTVSVVLRDNVKIRRRVLESTSHSIFYMDIDGSGWKECTREKVHLHIKSLGINMEVQDRFIVRQA